MSRLSRMSSSTESIEGYESCALHHVAALVKEATQRSERLAKLEKENQALKEAIEELKKRPEATKVISSGAVISKKYTHEEYCKRTSFYFWAASKFSCMSRNSPSMRHKKEAENYFWEYADNHDGTSCCPTCGKKPSVIRHQAVRGDPSRYYERKGIFEYGQLQGLRCCGNVWYWNQETRYYWQDYSTTLPAPPKVKDKEEESNEAIEFTLRGTSYFKTADNLCWRKLPNGEPVWEGIYNPKDGSIDRSVDEPKFE